MKHSGLDKTVETGLPSRPFTLIELLVVVGLMLMIMTFALPSFKRLATGKAVDVSCRMITGQLKLARAAAISEQKYLALVMPGENFDAPANDPETPYHFRSFRVAVVEATANDGEFTFVRWYPGTEWTYLPTGAAIVEVNGSYKAESADDTGNKCEVHGDDVTRNINNNWLGGADPLDLDDTSRLNNDDVICKVYEDGNSAEKMHPDGTNNSSSKWARAIIFNPKGRSCVSNEKTLSRYITVVQGNVDTSKAGDHKLSEADFDSMKIIKVHGLTGRTSYEDTVLPKE